MYAHVQLGVRNLRAMVAFYDAVLSEVGLSRFTDLERVGPAGVVWRKPGMRGLQFVLNEPFDAMPATTAHGSPISFLCASRGEVDADAARSTSTSTMIAPPSLNMEPAMYAPTLRIARPTDSIDALLPFYRDGLGLPVLGRFEDHAGFDGVMLGWPGGAYHFEFTHQRGHEVGRAPTKDNLIVFYLPDPSEWEAAVLRMRRSGFEPVASFNPYWDIMGSTFEDSDGYRVVLQRSTWKDAAV